MTATILRRSLSALVATVAALVCTSANATECNAYFPTAPEARWVFEIAQAGMTPLRQVIRVESRSVEGEDTTAELDQEISPLSPKLGGAGQRGSARTTVRCDASGVTLAIKGSAGTAAEGKTGAVRARMLALPPESKLAPGYTWRSGGEIETGERNAAGATIRAQVNRGSKLEAIEPIEVPAGKFGRALRISSVENLVVAGAPERRVRSEILEWYVRGLGLVRRERRVGPGAGAVTVERLVEYSGVEPEF